MRITGTNVGFQRGYALVDSFVDGGLHVRPKRVNFFLSGILARPPRLRRAPASLRL
jgi:hypothetical protein